MKLRHYFALGLIALITVGCTAKTTELSPSSLEDSPAATLTQPPASEAETTATEPIAQSPSSSTSTAAATVKSGRFVSGEHPTEGTVRIVDRNGNLRLELDQNFMTSELGPDLVVILHRSEDVIGSTEPPAYPINEGDYVLLAPLQEFSGAQSYAIPDSINLEDYQSAAIWCRKFNATFGAATLTPG